MIAGSSWWLTWTIPDFTGVEGCPAAGWNGPCEFSQLFIGIARYLILIYFSIYLNNYLIVILILFIKDLNLATLCHVNVLKPSLWMFTVCVFFKRKDQFGSLIPLWYSQSFMYLLAWVNCFHFVWMFFMFSSSDAIFFTCLTLSWAS